MYTPRARARDAPPPLHEPARLGDDLARRAGVIVSGSGGVGTSSAASFSIRSATRAGSGRS